jgi:hypothetical protein
MNYPYIFTNQEGILTQHNLNFNPLFVELLADVPLTWNIAGTIYIFKLDFSSKLLIGVNRLYFGYTHISIISENDYSIEFKPINYLATYTLKIGTD